MLLRIPFFSLTIFLLASSQGMAEDPVAQAFMPPPTTQDPVYDVVARIGEDYLRLGSLTTTPGVQTLEHLPKLSELSQERPHAILQLVPAGWTQPEPTGGSVLVKTEEMIRHVDLYLDQHGQVFHMNARVEGNVTTEVENESKDAAFPSMQDDQVMVHILPTLSGAQPQLTKKTEQESKEEIEEAEKGFFAKYWHFILPVVVILLLGGGQPEEGSSTEGDSKGSSSSSP
ncbi:MAG: hypothetical protein DHS80DRAFT_24351 [Piptocephalis tieghemiana]|nr:MAG: hypothetical protein DHS80DRAFT_24351 [Piptocephalis tieghemiana]